MAAIDYDELFTRIGAIGHVGYVLAGDQSAIPATLTTLIALYDGTTDVDLVGSIITNQANIPAPVVTPVTSITSLAQTTLVRMVNASVPSISTVPGAMLELIRQMKADSETVQVCTVGCTNAALSTNVGTGVVVTSTKRGDGLVQENIIPEISRLACVIDSYTGSATAGQEQFQLTGEKNTVSIWNYNYPQGSGSSSSVNAISASQNATATGNVLNNSDFEDWSGALSTDTLDNWVLDVGTYGTSIQQSATAFAGTKSLQFLAGATNNAIYQEFNDGTTGTASVLLSFYSYAVNFWARATAGTVSAGVLTVELVDDTNTVTTDGEGVANSFTVTLSSLTTSWVAVNGVFRIPDVQPSVLRLQLRISTDLAGDSVLVDQLAMAQLTASYAGGWGFAVFSSGTEFVTGDAFNVTATNDYGGSTYLASFQPLFNRLFQMAQNKWLLPSSGTPDQADTKITV